MPVTTPDFMSGLVSSAASSVGDFAKGAYSTTVQPIVDMAKGYANTTFKPADSPGENFIDQMAMGLLQAHKAQFSKAAQSYDQGHYTEAVGHALAGAVPFVGPAAAAAGETIGRGEYARGLGEATGLIGGALVGGKAGKAATRASRIGRAAEEGALVGKVAEEAPSLASLAERPLPDWAKETGPTPSRVSIRQGPKMTTAELDAKFPAKNSDPRPLLESDDTFTPRDSDALKAASDNSRIKQTYDAVDRTEASARLRNKPAPAGPERPTVIEDEPQAAVSKTESDRAANAYMRRGFGLRPTEPGPEVQVNPPAREPVSSLADESASSYANRLAKQVGPNQVEWIKPGADSKATAGEVRASARAALWRDYGIRELENKPGAPSGVQPETPTQALTNPETTAAAQNYLDALDKGGPAAEDLSKYRITRKPQEVKWEDPDKQVPDFIRKGTPPAQAPETRAQIAAPPLEGPLFGDPTRTNAVGGGGKDYTHLYFPEHKALLPIEDLKKEVEELGLTKSDAQVHAEVEQLLQEHPEYRERFSPEQLELNARYGGQPINANNVSAHEAGHVVVGNKIGLPVKYVSTVPEMLEGGRFSGGHTKTGYVKSVLSMNLHPEEHSVFTMAGKAGEEHMGLESDPKMALADVEHVRQLAKRAGREPEEFINEGQAKARDLLNGELADQHTKLTDFLRENYGKTLKYDEFKHLLKSIAPPIGLAAVQQLWSNYSEAKDKGNKGPGKFDVKPYDPDKMKFETVIADQNGTPHYLPDAQDKMVRNLINSMAPEQVPVGGLIFIPPDKYREIQRQVNHGTLFGKKIVTGNEENFTPGWGGDRLGDGFSLPDYRRTYLNAALLDDPKRLEYVLSHELGHNAAWLSKTGHPDLSEAGAEEFRAAYMKRGQQTRKNWSAIEKLPARRAGSYEEPAAGALMGK